MRRALASLLTLAACACACAPSQPTQVVEAPPPPLPPPAVYRAFHLDDPKTGFLEADAWFAVVLTRGVDAAPDALELLDSNDRSIEGTTVWLDRQLVVFRPRRPLPIGLDARVRLAVPLRASDGAVLSPREVDHGQRPPIAFGGARAQSTGSMGVVALSFTERVPAADVRAHGVLTVDGAPLEFTVRGAAFHLEVLAERGMPPGRVARFAWKEGRDALTSVGHVALEPIVVEVRRGFTVRVGESDDHCVADALQTTRCAVDRVHVVFGAPLADEALAAHVHPRLSRATTGDLRGHRFELPLSRAKPVTLVLDRALVDAFGQSPSGQGTTFQIAYAP